MPKSVENAVADSFEVVKENYLKFLLIYLFMGAVSIVAVLVFVVLIFLGLVGGLTLGNIGLIVAAEFSSFKVNYYVLDFSKVLTSIAVYIHTIYF